MKLHHYLLLFVLTFCWNGMKAQVMDFPELKKGTTIPASDRKTAINASSIEANVRNSLVIIQQNYQLKDVTLKKKNLFGRGGNKFFGTIYTIGVKSENGYYTDGRAMMPWLYDSNYSEYRNRNQYKPVIAETNYRLWNEQKYRKIGFDCDLDKLNKDSILFVKEKLSNPILLVDPKTGNQKGWIVWIVKDNKATEQDAFVLSTQATELNFDASNGTAGFNGNAPQQVVFGLFVTEQVNKRGQSIDVLSGFALKSEGKWLVKKPAVVTSDKTTKSVNSANPNELTPAKK